MNSKNYDIKFSYIENGAYIDNEGLKLRQQIYALWYPQWSEIYKSWGSSNVPSFRDFALYDLIHCIQVNEKVVGITAHRFMNLEDPLSENAEFIQSYGLENIARLKEMGINRIMTFESLLVDPTSRKSLKDDIHLSKLLSYMANHTFANSMAEGIIATARIDLKVPQLALGIGYEVIEANRKVRIIPCDIIVQRNRELFYPNCTSWGLSRQLWEDRNVYLSENYINHDLKKEQQKKAA